MNGEFDTVGLVLRRQMIYSSKDFESLMRSVDMLSKQLADSSIEKAALLQKIDEMMSMISVNNKVRFGSTSQKGVKNNNY